jgi:1-acyl-sn-glycerol-3-phosphate acyltransferase
MVSAFARLRLCPRALVGYEVEGLEHIPADGPALIVFYHGPLPTDMYFLMSKLILYRKRMLASVGDRFLQKVPGL